MTNSASPAAQVAPTRKAVSIKALNARTAAAAPFTFDYLDEDGRPTGIRLSVLGQQAETVQNAINKNLNDMRLAAALRAAEDGKLMAQGIEPEVRFSPIESDIAFGQMGAAVRLVGWEGIDEDWTPELALELVQGNPDIHQQVLKASNRLANFMTVLSRK